MTINERYNEIQKARATFLNALSVGAIIAGGLSALNEGRVLIALLFLASGLILHRVAVWMLQNMRIDDHG